MPLIHRKKPTEKPSSPPSEEVVVPDEDSQKKPHESSKSHHKKSNGGGKWSCIDSCCWFIGCVCVTWWFLLFLYNAMPASFPQYVTERITGPLPDPPGVKLKKEGLKAKHPVVFIPGIVTGGLELWEGKQCADGLFRKRLWGGTFGEVYRRLAQFSLFLLYVFILGFGLDLMRSRTWCFLNITQTLIPCLS